MNASEFFTQDMDEWVIIEGEVREVVTEEKGAEKVATEKLPVEVSVGDLGGGLHVASRQTAPITVLTKVEAPLPLAQLIAQARERKWQYTTPIAFDLARGAVVGQLDDYAGDTQRRHSFLLALFPYSEGTSKKLTEPDVRALQNWINHPQAKSEVNRVIADYLKARGQTELFSEA